MQEDLIPGLRLGGDLRLLAHRQVDADARLHDVDRDQADDQRERRDDLEVDDRAQPHAPDDLDVAGARDAGDQRREDQRRDDHLDHQTNGKTGETSCERGEPNQPGGKEEERWNYWVRWGEEGPAGVGVGVGGGVSSAGSVRLWLIGL